MFKFIKDWTTANIWLEIDNKMIFLSAIFFNAVLERHSFPNLNGKKFPHCIEILFIMKVRFVGEWKSMNIVISISVLFWSSSWDTRAIHISLLAFLTKKGLSHFYYSDIEIWRWVPVCWICLSPSSLVITDTKFKQEIPCCGVVSMELSFLLECDYCPVIIIF